MMYRLSTVAVGSYCDVVYFFFLMIRRPPRSTRTDTLFPYTTLFRSDLGCECSALVSFNVDGIAAADVRQALARQGINITANGVPYTPLDMQARGLHSVARASVSYLTSTCELDRLIAARSAERRVGKEWVSPCRFGGYAYT